MDEPDSSEENSTRRRSPLTHGNTSTQSSSLSSQIDAIAALFGTSFDHTERVEALCLRVKQSLAASHTELDADSVRKLVPLLRGRAGPMARPLFDLLVHAASNSVNPWHYVEGMLDASDAQLVGEVMELMLRLAKQGSLCVDQRVVSKLADRLEFDESSAGQEACLKIALQILTHASSGRTGGRDAYLRELYLKGESTRVRDMAARLLDLNGGLVPGELASALIGADNLQFLAPYLAYTRATHLELLHLASAPNLSSETVPSLQRARKICGEVLLRKVIAEVGWARVNLGLEVRRYVGCSFDGSLPLRLTPSQAALITACEHARPTYESFLFVAHGGLPQSSQSRDDGEDPVARFRAFNLAHAQLLAFLLDLSPLTREKVQAILDRVDGIVEDFTILFRAHSEECAILPALYRDLKERIIAEMEHDSEGHQLSPELTRLVQMFEEPRNLGEVRTLHGLKRYLHQRGLKLGFQLVGRTLSTNRSVDLVLTSRRRLLATVKRIRYADFEADSGVADPSHAIPYPISVIVDGFGRQLVHGQESFPQVDTYCYGNEVHYYLSYGSHPAFLRIDYSPPLSGGMIDLEYYGVSKFELTGHPDISLRAISGFFRQLEFDVQVDNTHIHVRYDKERAQSLGDICRKSEAVFRLVPYMMDLDWIIGSLKLNPDTRRVVAEAWAESFVRWGILPLRDLLTEDKTGIRVLTESAMGPVAEGVWTGRGPYVDRFSVPLAEDFHASILTLLEKVGLDSLWPLELGESRVVGQMDLERLFLEPLQEAVSRGEVVEATDGFQAQPAELFRREHEAERFAAILGAPDDVRAAAQLAELVAPLERSVRFHTTGSINGYDVQRGVLALRGEGISVYVLRDALGVIRLAMFARDGTLYLKRRSANEAWESNADCNAARLAALLLRNNYLAAGTELATRSGTTEPADLVASFRRPSPGRRGRGHPGERVLDGLRASPGRAVGRVVLGTTGRTPDDCTDAVLIAPTVGPQDNALLYQCSGIVSTGGGILSHAGLIAAQFHKPAVIIQGHWQAEAGEPLSLRYRITEHSEETKLIDGYRVAVYRHQREREYRLADGDLVVLNADDGTLTVLGHGRETLALYEGFRRFGEAGRPLRHALDAKEILALRGRLLQARHLMERLLSRLQDQSLARYALHELLLGSEFSGCDDERPRLLRQLISNPHIGAAVRDHLIEIADDLCCQAMAACEQSLSSIPGADSLYEVLLRRLQALRLVRTSADVTTSLIRSGIPVALPGGYDLVPINESALTRLTALRGMLIGKVISGGEGGIQLRHQLRQIERFDQLLGTSSEIEAELAGHRSNLAYEDRRKVEDISCRATLTAPDGGLELGRLIGLKAANLAEIERVGGCGMVPDWFVVSDTAFREMLSMHLDRSHAVADTTPPPDTTLREAIEAILAVPNTDCEGKSQQIRGLWRNLLLPDRLKQEILAAYDRLALTDSDSGQMGSDSVLPYVAIRSSTREEDAEAAARAGEFDTFLFIRGAEGVLEHVRLAWGGLWTARAIHNRALFATGPTETGGGVIVQRMISSRVSGVLHTVNMVTGEPNEIVINAGLGLGEGIVSGAVPADHIIVAKQGVLEGLPLRFRYTIVDKRERVEFDAKTGLGTQRVETLYHQRLRAALEYVELLELVRTAVQLEIAYGYPLDIEFGFEGTTLWILQARPIPTYMTVLRETLQHWPLVPPTRSKSDGRVAEVRR